MKTALIRAMVVALALTGAFAATHASTPTKASIVSTHMGSWPPPVCDPTQSDCGLGD